MLSNETTVGKYPIESVRMMNRIVEEMEVESLGQGAGILYNEWELSSQGQLAIALLQSAVRLASVLKAKAIVVVSQSGNSALLVSKCRPKNPIIAITGSLDTYRQLSLKWGVKAIYMEDMESLITQTAVFEAVGQRLLAHGICQTNDRIVITAGLPRLQHGSTNTIKVHQV
jgi:pyruvate kinase